MTIIHIIPNGQTVTPNMGAGHSGGVVSFEFFNAGGAPVIPVGVPRVFRTGGSVELEVQQFGRNEWRFNGLTTLVRVDLTGLTGYASYRASVWRTEGDVCMVPDGSFSGTRAVISQGYNEANVKNGRQSYVRFAWPTSDPIVAGTPRKTHFRTGALPVIFKGRVFDYVSEEMTLTLYEGATGVTGGTAVPVRNFNLVNPVASLVTVTKNVTTVTNGTVIDGPEYFFGATGASPQRAPGSIPAGRERVLKPNTSYLIEIAGAGRAQYMGDWYEGSPDLPLTL